MVDVLNTTLIERLAINAAVLEKLRGTEGSTIERLLRPIDHAIYEAAGYLLGGRKYKEAKRRYLENN